MGTKIFQRVRLREKMQFAFEQDFFDPLFKTLATFQNRPMAFEQNSDAEWNHVINLSQYPTKPEDLHVKMEKDSSVLSVSGKSEVARENKCSGMNVHSTHIWSKQIRIPENVDVATLTCKMVESNLTFKADLKNIEIEKSDEKQQEIPIEKLD